MSAQNLSLEECFFCLRTVFSCCRHNDVFNMHGLRLVQEWAKLHRQLSFTPLSQLHAWFEQHPDDKPLFLWSRKTSVIEEYVRVVSELRVLRSSEWFDAVAQLPAQYHRRFFWNRYAAESSQLRRMEEWAAVQLDVASRDVHSVVCTPLVREFWKHLIRGDTQGLIQCMKDCLASLSFSAMTLVLARAVAHAGVTRELSFSIVGRLLDTTTSLQLKGGNLEVRVALMIASMFAAHFWIHWHYINSNCKVKTLLRTISAKAESLVQAVNGYSFKYTEVKAGFTSFVTDVLPAFMDDAKCKYRLQDLDEPQCEQP